MATRSAIGIEKDGKILAAYCHWDGYLENNGEILHRHYQDPEKILKLVTLGDMSTLGEEFEPPEGVEHSYNKPAKNVTVYYGRDRGEEGTEFTVLNTRDEMATWYSDSEFFYLYTDGKWIYSQGRLWHDLKDAIESIDAERAE